MSRWCGYLNENGPSSITYLNSWFPVGRIAWEGLGCIALLEEVIPACYSTPCHDGNGL